MKMLTLVSLLVAASVASAQTETAPAQPAAAAPTEKAAPAVPVKKAKKAKKVAKPKAEMKSETMTPAAAATQTELAPAPATTTAAPAVTPAANTTTTAAETVAPPAKKWSASLMVNPSVDYNSPKEVGSLTKIGAGYKITPKIKASVGQTFQSVAVESAPAEYREYVNANNFRAAYTDLTVSTSVPGMLKSDDISVSLNARLLTEDALYSRVDTAGYDTIYDLNIAMPYTITPKVSVELFTQLRNVQQNDFNHKANRVIFGPSISYAFNDIVSVYQAANVIVSLKDGADFRRSRERGYLETGVNLAPPVKGLNITMLVSQDKEINAGAGNTVTPFNLYKPNDGTLVNGERVAANGEKTMDIVSYEAVVSYSF